MQLNFFILFFYKKKAAQSKKSSKKPVGNVNSFLHKLWSLVNDESLSEISWTQDGEKIIIENPAKFTSKVLVNCEIKIFKTKNISSFIRQLNLYGFRRVKETSAKTPIIFKHHCFKRGRLDLLGLYVIFFNKKLSNSYIYI